MPYCVLHAESVIIIFIVIEKAWCVLACFKPHFLHDFRPIFSLIVVPFSAWFSLLTALFVYGNENWNCFFCYCWGVRAYLYSALALWDDSYLACSCVNVMNDLHTFFHAIDNPHFVSCELMTVSFFYFLGGVLYCLSIVFIVLMLLQFDYF